MSCRLNKKGLVFGIIVVLIGAGVASGFNIQIKDIKKSIRGEILYVGGSEPGNYSKIQDAIDDAADGDTVFIYDDSSPYYENVYLKDKSINVVGENTDTTIIDAGTGGEWSWAFIASHADGSTVSDLTFENVTSIYGTNYAFMTMHSDDMKIINCRIRDSINGMLLFYSANTYMRNNRFVDNQMNFGISGWSQASDFCNDIDTSNTINGKPMYNLVDESDIVIDGIDIGWLGLIGCTGITVKNVEISEENEQNILIIDTKDSTISNCKIYNSGAWSISIGFDSDYNIIKDCPKIEGVGFITNNEYAPDNNQILNCDLTFGIAFQKSNYNTVDNCNIDLELDKQGITSYISLGDSKYNTISNCDISNNRIGIQLNGGTFGCHYNNIINNTFSDFSHCAVYLSQDCDYNNIVGNQFNNSNSYEDYASVYIKEPDSYGGNDHNMIYHNSFTNNLNNAYDGCDNTWDDDYPSGGNYWDDYTGEDADGDGIGDTPYPIPGGDNEDRYPLMKEPCNENHPPSVPFINGPTSGKADVNYDYNFVATDPDGNDVWYHISWGDKEIIYIHGPYPSGEEITLPYKWPIKGTYIISCWASDIYDEASDISTLEVTIMPKDKILINTLFTRLLERFSNAFPILWQIPGL